MSATLHIVGVGPGDPDLMTVKAARIVAAAPIVAWFAKAGRDGLAFRTAANLIAAAAERLRFDYPFTVERAVADAAYGSEMHAFYDRCAETLAGSLSAGRNVALLCEGDPFFYGSAMYLFDRLASRFAVDVVPGVTGMSGCWARARLPMAHGDDALTVLPGTLDEDTLANRLAGADAAVVMKVGRHLPKIRAALDRAGRTARAVCVVGGTMPHEKIFQLGEACDANVPYFAVVLVPGREAAR